MRARVVSVLFFPLVLGGALAAGAWVVARGGQPVLVLAASALCVLCRQRLWPHLPSWQRSHRDVAVDLAHVVSVSLTSFAMQAIVPRALAPLAAALAPLGTASLWPESWPLLAQLPLALLAAELV